VEIVDVAMKSKRALLIGIGGGGDVLSTIYVRRFLEKFGVDLNKPTILTTFHPETASFEKNEQYIKELLSALSVLINKYQVVITMPNADTEGLMIRRQIETFGQKHKTVFLVESFGMKGYLSCIKHSKMLLGNTSFIDALYMTIITMTTVGFKEIHPFSSSEKIFTIW